MNIRGEDSLKEFWWFWDVNDSVFRIYHRTQLTTKYLYRDVILSEFAPIIMMLIEWCVARGGQIDLRIDSEPCNYQITTELWNALESGKDVNLDLRIDGKSMPLECYSHNQCCDLYASEQDESLVVLLTERGVVPSGFLTLNEFIADYSEASLWTKQEIEEYQSLKLRVGGE